MVNYTDEDEDQIIDNSCRLDSNYGAIIIESPVANGLHPRGPHPSGPYGGNDHHKNDDDYGKEREEEDESEQGKERNGARKSSKHVDWPAGRGKAVFIIAILTLLNAANKLDRFVLFEVIKDMAADLEFGDRSCLNSSVTFDPETDVEERIKYACAPDSCDGSSPMSIKEGIGEPHNDGDDEAPCQWQYWGTGLEYQLLAGPAFIVVVGLMRIPLTFMMERGRVDGRHVLVVCAVAWSLATLMTGFATTLWHVVICRILLGLL